jgi:hypothetical protein
MSSLHQNCRKRYCVHIWAEDREGGIQSGHMAHFFAILTDFSFCNILHYLVFNIKLQVFGRSNDVPRPSVVEEIKFSEEVACGGYHTCVVTGISFVLKTFFPPLPLVLSAPFV